MDDELKKKLIDVVKILFDRATDTQLSIEALQYTQAACNATNAVACISNAK